MTVDWIFILEKVGLITIIMVITLLVAMYATYGERKVAAFMQDRYGPDRAGPWGILQPLCDGVKLFMKEEVIPLGANKFLFVIGPCIAMFTSLMTSAIIPFGSSLQIGDYTIDLQVADINVGVLYIFALISMGVYGMMLGGWASNNKYSLFSAIRGVSQLISYEIAMGLSLISLLLISHSLSLRTIVDQQIAGMWNICYQPIGFFIFFVCSLAECNRNPFDLPEAENELNFGFHQEYSSMKLGFFMFSEYVNMFISGLLMSSLFFGGYDIPFVKEELWFAGMPAISVLLGTAVLLGKAFIFMFVFMWIRWTIPRFRYDQLMNLGWKKLIPLALLNMLVTAVVVLLTR